MAFFRGAWIRRRRRSELAHRLAELLPPGYDPAALEFEVRSDFCQTAGNLVSALAPTRSPRAAQPVASLLGKALEARARREQLEAALGAAEIGVFMSADVFSAIQAIDSNFYKAMSQYAGEKIVTFGDLSRQMQQSFGGSYDFWGGLHRASDDQLKGHVAEYAAGQHLANAGFTVNFPDSVTQPGWDFVLSDEHLSQAVNVKLYSDGCELSHHFATYSDIPAVVPGDMAHIPENAVHFDSATGAGIDQVHEALATGAEHMVLVDDALSVVDVGQQTADAADTALSGATSAIEAHLPYVTLAFSLNREIRLLVKQDTDIAAAAKNVGLDVAGMGIGAFIGSWAGGAIGSIIPGPGTVVGAALGTFVGGMFGKAATSNVKRIQLDQAKEVLDIAIARLTVVHEHAQSSIKDQVHAKTSEIQAELNAATVAEHQNISNARLGLAHELKTGQLVDSAVAIALLGVADAALAEAEESVRCGWAGLPTWSRWFWPTVDALAHAEALRFLKHLRDNLAHQQAAYAGEAAISRPELLRLLGHTGAARQEACKLTRRVYERRAKREAAFRAAVEVAVQHVLKQRAKATKEIAEFATAAIDSAKSALAPLIERRDAAAQGVLVEAKKLGLVKS